VNALHPSSSEHDSLGSRDTGIDLNPDDGCHRPSLVDRLHRRRSRSVAHSHSAATAGAVGDGVPQLIDADDETDDPSVVGKDVSAARRSTSRSASFDKTMEWLMTRTGSSQCSKSQLVTTTGPQLYDAAGFNDGVADDEAGVSPQDLGCDPARRSWSASPVRSVSNARRSESGDRRLAVSASENLNVCLRRRVVDEDVSTAGLFKRHDDVDDDDEEVVAEKRRQRLNVDDRRETMSSADSETNGRNRRRNKEKVFVSVSRYISLLFNLFSYTFYAINMGLKRNEIRFEF